MKIDTSDYYPYTPSGSCEDPENFKTVEVEAAEERVSPEAPATEPVVETGTGESPVSRRADKDPEGETWQRVADRLSNVLSWVLVPLLMPLYAILICFHISVLQFATPATKWWFSGIIFVITCVIPMLMILLLKKLGLVEDIGLNGRKERLIPYIITILSFGACGWFMLVKGAPIWTAMFFFGGALAGVVNMIINLWWKISAHAAAIAGIVALLVCISREPLPHPHIAIWVACAIGLAGLLGSARVWLGRHTVMQVLAGSAVGFLCVFFLTLI